MKNKEFICFQNYFTYLKECFARGLRAIPKHPMKAILTALYWIAALCLLSRAMAPATGFLDRLFQPLSCTLTLAGTVLLFVGAVTLFAIPKGAGGILRGFQEIALVNAAGTPPLPLKQEKEGLEESIELLTLGIPKEAFSDKLADIEAALNCHFVRLEDGADKQHIILRLISGEVQIPNKVFLPHDKGTPTAQVLLGEAINGPVKLDFNKTPHALFGGSTGSGKTTLIKSVVAQLLAKGEGDVPGVDVRIIDLKGGQDYPPIWRDGLCQFFTDAGDALSTLDLAVQELERRKSLFAQLGTYKGLPCSSLEDYNRLSGERLQRIVIVIDEIAELTDTTGMDKPYKERSDIIVSHLSTIARLGRSVGVNLIIGTQRPDANVVAGQIKSNIDYRVCGKADSTLSTIILGDGSANDKIPKDSQGLFLNHEGTIFRGYLLREEI